MHSDEYRRLHAVCLIMAEQSNLPDVQARWHALAQACFSLTKDLPAGSRSRKCVEDRAKAISTRLSTRVADGLWAA